MARVKRIAPKYQSMKFSSDTLALTYYLFFGTQITDTQNDTHVFNPLIATHMHTEAYSLCFFLSGDNL